MASNRIQSFQVDQNELSAALGSNPNLQSNVSHLNIQDIGVNSHTQIDSHIADSTIHFSAIDGLSDVTIALGSPIAVDNLLAYDTTTSKWVNKTLTSLQGNISHLNIQDIGVNSHAQIDSHIADSTIHFSTIDGLSDVTIALGSPIADDNVISYDTTTNKWINKTLTSMNRPSSYFIDVNTVGSPITVNSLPTGWTATSPSVGQITITHNLGNANIGLAINVYYNTAIRIVNPTTITTSSVTFQITDSTGTATDGNIVGMLMI